MMDDSLFKFDNNQFEILLNKSIKKALKEFIDEFTFISNSNKNLKILTRAEAAKMLKITLPTLSDWTKRNLIKAYTIGGRIYYKSNELESALTKL